MPLDLGIGLLGAVLQAVLAPEDLTFRLLLLGAAFALLPDLDFLVSAVRKRSIRKVDHTHRDLLHYPIPYLLAGFAILRWLAPEYIPLFIILSLAHFIHDSMGVGWGVMWLYPYSKRYLKLFTTRDGRFSWTSAAFWRPEERDAVIAQRHDPDWIRNEYGRLTRTSAIEITAFVIALCAVLYLTRVL